MAFHNWKELQHHLPRWYHRKSKSIQDSKQDWLFTLDEDAEFGGGREEKEAAAKCKNSTHKPYSYLKW